MVTFGSWTILAIGPNWELPMHTRSKKVSFKMEIGKLGKQNLDFEMCLILRGEELGFKVGSSYIG